MSERRNIPDHRFDQMRRPENQARLREQDERRRQWEAEHPEEAARAREELRPIEEFAAQQTEAEFRAAYASGQRVNPSWRSPFDPHAPSFEPPLAMPGPYRTQPADAAEISDPAAYPTIHDLVARLLTPDFRASAFEEHHGQPGRVIISLRWVQSRVGERHFVNNRALGRSVLTQESKIRTHGLQAGLPADYYRWLCGPDDEDLAAAVESPEWQMSPLHFVTLVENFRLVPPGQRPA